MYKGNIRICSLLKEIIGKLNILHDEELVVYTGHLIIVYES
jgi:hypothetical protein